MYSLATIFKAGNEVDFNFKNKNEDIVQELKDDQTLDCTPQSQMQ